MEEMDASRTDMKKRCDLTRKMILQQAIKGALVPQQTSEGTAQDLVDNIREEKAVLVSEKKLKKDPKSRISIGMTRAILWNESASKNPSALMRICRLLFQRGGLGQGWENISQSYIGLTYFEICCPTFSNNES